MGAETEDKPLIHYAFKSGKTMCGEPAGTDSADSFKTLHRMTCPTCIELVDDFFEEM